MVDSPWIIWCHQPVVVSYLAYLFATTYFPPMETISLLMRSIDDSRLGATPPLDPLTIVDPEET